MKIQLLAVIKSFDSKFISHRIYSTMASVYLKPFPTSAIGYRIELPMKNRLGEISKFLHDHYHGEETLSKSLKAGIGEISDEEAKLIGEDEDNVIAAVYENSPCLIAIHDETNEIVGVLLTILSTKPEEGNSGAASAALFGSGTFKSNFVKNYYKYLSKMDEEANIFEKFPNAQAVLEFFAIAVHKDHRQKGLAKDLSSVAIQSAKNMPEVGVIFGVYTSIYSKRVAEESGMKSILDFDLESDFLNDDGEPAFQDTKPNNIVSVMALEISRE